MMKKSLVLAMAMALGVPVRFYHIASAAILQVPTCAAAALRHGSGSRQRA